MKKLYIIILKVFLIIVFANLKAISDEKIKIGLIVPLSGEYSYIGKSIVKSTRMALKQQPYSSRRQYKSYEDMIESHHYFISTENKV